MKPIMPGKNIKFKRRMTKKTNYASRYALLKSGTARLVVRRSHNFIQMQVINYEPSGDRTVAAALSKELKELGWKFHCGSLPASYLTGLLAGAKALQAGVKAAVVDIGLQVAAKNGVLFAAAQGAKDAGLEIELGEGITDAKRLRGEHIAAYAKATKGTDAYKRQFSACLKAGADPEHMPQNFDDVKAKIFSQIKGEKQIARHAVTKEAR